MHSLTERVLSYIRRQELLKAGDRVGVAVSGGIDSVALLRLLLELRGGLGIVLSVVHFNHRLRGAESDGDQEFVAGLARAHDLEFYSDSDAVAQHAAQEHVSVEAAARELRYGFFRSLLGEDGAMPQGLKPKSIGVDLHGPEGPLFHGRESAAPSGGHAALDKILTGHTLDDQAETVLMRVIRGAGLRGLGAIYPQIVVEDDDGEICGEIVRPLLGIRHRDLEQYLNAIGQTWREDSSNADGKFTRNRVRKLLVPLIEREFNPSVAENLAELAEIARGEEDYWQNESSGWLGTTVQWAPPKWARDTPDAPGEATSLVQIVLPGVALTRVARIDNGASTFSPADHTPQISTHAADLQSRIDDAPWLVANASVSRMWFLGEPIAVQRRLVKAIGEHAGIPLDSKHVEEILRIAAGDEARSEVSLPLGWRLKLDPEELKFLTPDLREPIAPRDYEYELPVPGRIAVYEAGSAIEARWIKARTIEANEVEGNKVSGGAVSDEAYAAYNRRQLLDAQSVAGLLKVRNWRPGDRFWPAHTKSPKKIKELLQELHIAQPERSSWPVVVSGDEIIWTRGFSVSAKNQAKPGRDAIAIVEERYNGAARDGGDER